MAHQQILRTSTLPPLDRRMAYAREILNYWMERARTRRQLRALDDRILEDIGMTRDQAAAESAKYFWQH